MSEGDWKSASIINKRYLIKKKIGQGGMGKTYLAQDLQTNNNPVALKLIKISELDDWKVLELFERETKILKSIEHPLIPDYLDYFKIEDENEIYYVLVQEYIAGSNLSEIIDSGKRFTTAEIILIFESLLNTLSYIHSLNPRVIHRDINPKNIILKEDKRVYLVDFGAVADLIHHDSGSTVVGTIGYMPPEQLYGKVQPSSDLYAAAATILFLLTGKEPADMELKNMRLDYDNLVTIPKNLKLALDRMLIPDMEKRVKSAEQALEILHGKTESRELGYKKLRGSERVIMTQREDGSKEIMLKSSKLTFIFLIFFAIGWNSFLSVFINSGFNTADFGGLPFPLLVFMLPFFGVGIGLIAFVLFGLFGKTTIILDGRELNYSLSIFNIKFKAKAIAYSDIGTLQIEESRGSKGSVSYSLAIYSETKTINIGKMLQMRPGDLKILKTIIEEEIQ